MKFSSIQSVCAALIFLSSCGNHDKEKQGDKAFFPVNAQVIAELKALDTLPLAIFRYHQVKDGRTDTSIVSKEQLRTAAKLLLDADITSAKDQSRYTESVYLDQSIGQVTMSYAPNEKNTPVNKVDVYLDPESNKMKQVYVETQGPWTGDSTVLRKMLWSPGHFFQVSTIISAGDTSNRWFQDKYSWESVQ
jgi:hypothetical protein